MPLFSQKRPKYGEDPNFLPNTVIGEGVTMMGGLIKGINSVMVSGLVFGDINVDGEVIVTETGYVKGDIVSTFAVIAGIVEGNLRLSSYASLKATASVTGDISCTAISIDDGAVFTGACNMIVKSGALTKKLKRINEQAIAVMDEKTKLIKSEDDLVMEEIDDVIPADEIPTPAMEIADTDEPENGWYSLDDELAEPEEDASPVASAAHEDQAEQDLN